MALVDGDIDDTEGSSIDDTLLEAEGGSPSVTSLSTTVTQGLVTDNGDGTFNYDPNGKFDSLGEGETATDQFSYVVSDGIDTDTAIVTILITGGNEAPSAVDDAGSAFRTNADLLLTTPSLLLNDSDPDGDLLTVTSLDLAGTQGTVILQADGSVTCLLYTSPSPRDS